MDSINKELKLQQTVIKSFFNEEGKLKHLPAQLKKKLIVLEYMCKKLDKNKRYSEQEINDYIKGYHEDYATIRRELYIHRFVNRDQEIYEVNVVDDWRNWRTLG